MKLIKSKLDYEKKWTEKDVLCFTANSTICSTGLLMGAGNAKACKLAFPGINVSLGKRINQNSIYGIYPIFIHGQKIIAFQTKTLWILNSGLELIEYSVEKLKEVAEGGNYLTYHLPFPGCGHGGLQRSEVLPLLEALPGNVWIYEP